MDPNSHTFVASGEAHVLVGCHYSVLLLRELRVRPDAPPSELLRTVVPGGGRLFELSSPSPLSGGDLVTDPDEATVRFTYDAMFGIITAVSCTRMPPGTVVPIRVWQGSWDVFVENI